MKVPFAWWVMVDSFDAEYAVPLSHKNILSLKTTLHFPNLITTWVRLGLELTVIPDKLNITVDRNIEELLINFSSGSIHQPSPKQ